MLELMKKNSINLSNQLPIDLDLVNVDQIVVPDKFNHSDGGFKFFIGFKEDDIVKRLCIIFPQITVSIKYFENGGKSVFCNQRWWCAG